MINYSTKELFEMKPGSFPEAFTALNGAFETYELKVSDVDFLDEEKGTEDLRKVLDILRSNGAQPVVTKVLGSDSIKFSVEQSWTFGLRAPEQPQVSERSLSAQAEEDIETIFAKAGLTAEATFVSTIGNLCEETESSSS